MAKKYSPQELSRFVWEVNEAQLQLYEGKEPSIKNALELTTGIHEAFRQAYVEIWMLKNISAQAWFEAEDGYRKNWAAMIRNAKERYDALTEAEAAQPVAEQMAGAENPVMAALQAIVVGIQSMNEKMDMMMPKDKAAEEPPAPPVPPTEDAPPAEDEPVAQGA